MPKNFLFYLTNFNEKYSVVLSENTVSSLAHFDFIQGKTRFSKILNPVGVSTFARLPNRLTMAINNSTEIILCSNLFKHCNINNPMFEIIWIILIAAINHIVASSMSY